MPPKYSQSLLRYILAMTLTPATALAPALALAQQSGVASKSTTTKTRRQEDNLMVLTSTSQVNSHSAGYIPHVCVRLNPIQLQVQALISTYCTFVCVVVLSPRGRPLKHAPATMNLALLHRSLRPAAANNTVSCRCTQRPKYQHSGRVERPVAWSRPGKGGANALELEQQRK